MPAVGMVAAGLAVIGGPAAAEQQERAAGCRSGYVALTFDDGPAGPTDRLVRILRRAGVPATFFMVGQRVAAAPATARRVERAGFLVANHTWAHADMRTQSAAEVAQTLRATQRALRRAGTHPTRLMRPPYGALDDTALRAIHASGYVPVLWTVDSRDWAGGTAAQIANRILAGLRPNAQNIVLQHDGVGHSPTSVAAVPRVIRGARARGYCFTALDERGRPGFHTPTASLSVSDRVREGGAAVATVRLSGPPGRATSVVVRTRGSTARIGRDVARVARRVVIPAGRLATRVRIPVRRDGLDEHTERFRVVLGGARGVRLGRRERSVRIVDVDRPPVIRGEDLSVLEPVTGPTTATVELRLSRASGKAIPLTVRTRHGTADGDDYVARRVRTVLQPGETVLRLDVRLLPDALEETEETFTVEVVRSGPVRVGRPATVTITPPPPPPPPPPGPEPPQPT
ncbi:polysaccharide deacetylase family protein [Nocardioides coralli]|uniref:polysaccharide deacetylase family protein n=1 Tax=Nocardioides coralli TaxID=2872154 RepID=UPI001CA41993|nr:polysaccharide deacetylase family protein [Nocardioides coralli]QZY27701.1 polysaccharide deacetylase family protein [Nocardioides coralli]